MAYWLMKTEPGDYSWAQLVELPQIPDRGALDPGPDAGEKLLRAGARRLGGHGLEPAFTQIVGASL